MAKKKVVIVIVEGISDERAISSIRKYVRDTFGVFIHLTHGDVFSDNSYRKGIKAVVGDQVQKVMQQYKYTKNEILAVIQVADTDGAFINDDLVIVDENIGESKKYFCNSIKVSSQKKAINIQQRNKVKAAKLKTMYPTLKVQKSINYHLLYFSCNLDHVIHGEMNLNDKEKEPKAKEFDKKYKGKPKDFVDFFKKEAFAVKGTKRETWEFIQRDNNSLKQYSNFHLIFDILDDLME
ncbi:hypothetical protein AS034_16220 [[Bacillus] enclensis]|uniref:DUF4276 family protein n=1 Tax=[Bacillus] enclensis TaxID=1402860 RepID=A0A0V8HD01_9BACI|nr:hypothetical protein [[Bacillus] enclensis]KSU60387.1 hypothetical protein AS034_16220 [[Bacillus] enclensis]SCC23934.1 hypothetical protein GA0061094_3354 [[Bacillus] enclensis]